MTRYRGIGEVFVKDPIAAVVEIMHRKPREGGTGWEFVRPFTAGMPKGLLNAFHILGSVPSTTIMRGGRPCSAREGHPAFAGYNSCDPNLCRTLRCKLIHYDEAQCFRYELGAYQGPEGEKGSPASGWWCRGDATMATRWDGTRFIEIRCPARLCEYQEKKWGKFSAALCKPNISLLAQFNWPDKDDKPSPLPKVVFQWNTSGWNNYGALKGFFDDIQTRAGQCRFTRQIGADAKGKPIYEPFPVIGATLTLNLKEHVQQRKGRVFPEVGVSFDGDVMAWMGKVQELRVRTPLILEGPKPLELAPPEGYTEADMEDAKAAVLDANYRPANERKGRA